MSQQPEQTFQAVTEAAEEAVRQSEDGALTEIESRLASLEIFAEDAAKRELANAELTSYISDLRSELRDLKTLRTIYGFVAISIVAGLVLFLFALVFVSGSPIYTMGQYTASALLISLVTGIVLLVTTLAKGVHRPSGDLAKDEPLPQIPQYLSELIKQIRA